MGEASHLVKPWKGSKRPETVFLLPAETSELSKALPSKYRAPTEEVACRLLGTHLLKGVVPEYTDRLAPLLGLQQGKLHQNGPLQRAGEWGPLTVHHSTHYRGVDDGPVRQSVAERDDYRDKHD